jgi:hypothetical protein
MTTVLFQIRLQRDMHIRKCMIDDDHISDRGTAKKIKLTDNSAQNMGRDTKFERRTEKSYAGEQINE